jgi:hypothetical protein
LNNKIRNRWIGALLFTVFVALDIYADKVGWVLPHWALALAGFLLYYVGIFSYRMYMQRASVVAQYEMAKSSFRVIKYNNKYGGKKK